MDSRWTSLQCVLLALQCFLQVSRCMVGTAAVSPEALVMDAAVVSAGDSVTVAAVLSGRFLGEGRCGSKRLALGRKID